MHTGLRSVWEQCENNETGYFALVVGLFASSSNLRRRTDSIRKKIITVTRVW